MQRVLNHLLKHLSVVLAALFVAGIANVQAQITSKTDWDQAFAAEYGDGSDLDKLLSQSGYDDSQARFAWHGNYWLRAFVTMAETFDDPSYLDKAARLIDYMLYYRDDARAARGEIDILAEPYYDAPPFYLMNRDQVAPGWRHVLSSSGKGRKVKPDQRRILTLDDGQVTNGIMRYVDLVYDNPKYATFQAKAEEHLAQVIETVDAHIENYIFDRYPSVPGHYYWPKPDGTGHWSSPIPYNQGATMGISLLLLDDLLGGGTEYGRMAEGIVQYWLNYVRLQSNGSYVWDYAPYNADRVEDSSHAHIDVGFLILAYEWGVGGLTAEDMTRLSKTWVDNVYLGNAKLTDNIDGSGGESSATWDAGFDWIDLAEFDLAVLDIALEVFEAHHSSPTWARPFLGWAEILRWQKTANPGPNPNPDPTPDPDPTDVDPPEVVITDPLNGDTVVPKSIVAILVSATDNVEVNRAEIYVNGGLKVTLIGTGPYQFDWRVPGKKNKVHEITAKAYDPSGNVGIDQIFVEAR